VPGRLHLVYQESGGSLMMMENGGHPPDYRLVDPRTGEITGTGRLAPGEMIAPDPDRRPRLVIFTAMSD
jgi:hypothetical protein